MKPLFSLFIIFFLASALLFPSFGFSQSSPSAMPVATVNIQDAKIVSQNNADFGISFTITNRKGLQTGLKYGVELRGKSSEGQFVADKKIYDETLILHENSTVKKTISYTAPSTLHGDFTLFLTIQNENGFPFGMTFVKEVSLIASEKGIELLPSTCFLSIGKDKQHYGLLDGVDVGAAEALTLTCSAINNASVALLAVPFFETHYRSVYGELAETEAGTSSSISFAPGEKKMVSIAIPKGLRPELYEAQASFVNNGQYSNTVTLHYIVRGISARIEKLSVDKDSYAKGDTALLQLLWTPPSASFLRSTTTVAAPSISLSGTITDEKGKVCAPVPERPLSNEALQTISIALPVSCVSPHVLLTLSSEGATLDEKEFVFTAKETALLHPRTVMIVLGALLLAALLSLWQQKREKKKVIAPTRAPHSI